MLGARVTRQVLSRLLRLPNQRFDLVELPDRESELVHMVAPGYLAKDSAKPWT
jgi:hypothetical protein